jgi:heme O synthase-like polyprenyltransferase
MVFALDITNETINPIAKFSDIGSLVNPLISLFVILISLVFVFIMLSGAYTFMTAGGDAEKVKQAQKTFKYALIGLIVVLVSFLIVKLIERFLGIDLPL